MDNNILDQAIATNEELASLHDKKAALVRELGKSLRIMRVWPEAFAHGGGVSIKTRGHGRSAAHYLMRSDGKEVPLLATELAYINGTAKK